MMSIKWTVYKFLATLPCKKPLCHAISDADGKFTFISIPCASVDESKNHLPDILCIIQVCLEGKISHRPAMNRLKEGHSPHEDQIPWKFCEQFRDSMLPSLSGARIVRIVVHPSAVKLGYGSMAVKLLARYYEGQLTSIDEIDVQQEKAPVEVTEAAEKVYLLEETIKPRANLPPLLTHLREWKPEKLHYIGVSFGLTLVLFRFWRRQCCGQCWRSESALKFGWF